MTSSRSGWQCLMVVLVLLLMVSYCQKTGAELIKECAREPMPHRIQLGHAALGPYTTILASTQELRGTSVLPPGSVCQVVADSVVVVMPEVSTTYVGRIS